MGSKWGKVGLTADGVLYVSEQPDPEDVKRAADEAKQNKEEVEERLRVLGFRAGKASWS